MRQVNHFKYLNNLISIKKIYVFLLEVIESQSKKF